VSKAVPASFQNEGDAILLLGGTTMDELSRITSFGSSEYARTVLGSFWGTPPTISLAREASLHRSLHELAKAGLIASATDISDGGLAAALAEAGFAKGLGAEINISSPEKPSELLCLFGETSSTFVVTCPPARLDEIERLLSGRNEGTYLRRIGSVTSGKIFININGQSAIVSDSKTLRPDWSTALQSTMNVDTVTA
jgi:phosphoribosylformylglycinamidine synthase